MRYRIAGLVMLAISAGTLPLVGQSTSRGGAGTSRGSAGAGAATVTPPPPPSNSGAPKETLTNQTIVQMVVGKLPNDLILAKIQSSKPDFDLTVDGLISLTTNKVPTDVMKSMMAATGSKKVPDEVLTNESIIKLVSSKVNKDIILAKIHSTKTEFDVSSNGLVSLNTAKVPKDITKVMLAGG